MTTGSIIELAVAVGLMVVAVILYRRRGAEGEAKTGSQTAVLLLFIGIIMAIHALGLLEYRPHPGGL